MASLFNLLINFQSFAVVIRVWYIHTCQLQTGNFDFLLYYFVLSFPCLIALSKTFLQIEKEWTSFLVVNLTDKVCFCMSSSFSLLLHMNWVFWDEWMLSAIEYLFCICHTDPAVLGLIMPMWCALCSICICWSFGTNASWSFGCAVGANGLWHFFGSRPVFEGDWSVFVLVWSWNQGNVPQEMNLGDFPLKYLFLTHSCYLLSSGLVLLCLYDSVLMGLYSKLPHFCAFHLVDVQLLFILSNDPFSFLWYQL